VHFIKNILKGVISMKKLNTGLTVISLIALLVFAVQGWAETSHKKDIVDTAIAAGSFNTLAKALTAAGLVETLKGKGPFTVFAPTDDAFAKLPAGTLEDLLKPENKEKLKSILTYHVVSGKVKAAAVTKLKKVKTVNGQDLKITVKDGTVMVDEAKVAKTDIMCSNGVIHIIDAVLMPK
jgi:transforming growth factor-beta-induced protein